MGLDVVGVTADTGKEELRNPGFATLQFLSQSIDQRQPVLVALFEFFPLHLSTAGGLLPAPMIPFDLLIIVAEFFIASASSVLDSRRQNCRWSDLFAVCANGKGRNMFVERPSELRGPAVDSTGKELNEDTLLQEVSFRRRRELVQFQSTYILASVAQPSSDCVRFPKAVPPGPIRWDQKLFDRAFPFRGS